MIREFPVQNENQIHTPVMQKNTSRTQKVMIYLPKTHKNRKKHLKTKATKNSDA